MLVWNQVGRERSSLICFLAVDATKMRFPPNPAFVCSCAGRWAHTWKSTFSQTVALRGAFALVTWAFAPERAQPLTHSLVWQKCWQAVAPLDRSLCCQGGIGRPADDGGNIDL